MRNISFDILGLSLKLAGLFSLTQCDHCILILALVIDVVYSFFNRHKNRSIVLIIRCGCGWIKRCKTEVPLILISGKPTPNFSYPHTQKKPFNLGVQFLAYVAFLLLLFLFLPFFFWCICHCIEKIFVNKVKRFHYGLISLIITYWSHSSFYSIRLQMGNIFQSIFLNKNAITDMWKFNIFYSCLNLPFTLFVC